MKKIAGIGVGLALTFVGVGGAQAWTWASSSNPIVMTGGGGYGNLSTGTTKTLQSWLRDTRTGDGRVYAKVAINQGAQGTVANLTSGQRSDGESSYARMADKSITLQAGSYSYTVRTCRSATLQDPCSEDTRRYP
jgi:hypothetical protein